MDRSTSRVLPVLAAALLAACGGGSGGPDAVMLSSDGACTYISGGDTAVSWQSPEGEGAAVHCRIENPGRAADGDPESAAYIEADGVTGGCTLRVTAQSGVVFAAGSVASVLARMSWSGASSPADPDWAVGRTLLQGQVQDEVAFNDGSPGINVDGTSGTGKAYFDIPTTKPFDAVEFSVGNATQSQTVEVFEFCSERN